MSAYVHTAPWACTWWVWVRSPRCSQCIWMAMCCSRLAIRCHRWAWSVAQLPLPAWHLYTPDAGCSPHTPPNTWKVHMHHIHSGLIQHLSFVQLNVFLLDTTMILKGILRFISTLQIEMSSIHFSLFFYVVNIIIWHIFRLIYIQVCFCSWHAWFCGCEEVWRLWCSQSEDDHRTET